MFKYSSQFMSKVGGSMGLWLGLGLVQAWQVLANTLSLFFFVQICKQIDKRMSCFDILASMSVPCFKLSLAVIFVSTLFLVHFTLPVLNLRLPAQTNKLVVE